MSKQVNNLERQVAYLPTPDAWYPTRADGLVRVLFVELTNGEWQVACWGEDDFGMELDFPSREPAVRLFRQLLRCAFITQDNLQCLGFHRA